MKYLEKVFSSMAFAKILLCFFVLGLYQSVEARKLDGPLSGNEKGVHLEDGLAMNPFSQFPHEDCTAFEQDRSFEFCLPAGGQVPFEELVGAYGEGVRFFNQLPDEAEGLEEYTSSHPFPSLLGPASYFAVTGDIAGDFCAYSFELNLTQVTSTPVVEDYMICQGDDLRLLTLPQANEGQDGKPLKLYVFLQEEDEMPVQVPENIDEKRLYSYLNQFLEEGGKLPEGSITLYLAEGYNASCIGPKVPINITVFGEVAPPRVRNKVVDIDYGTTHYIARASRNHTLVWYDYRGNLLEEEPRVNLGFPGVHTAYVSQKNAAGCESARVPVVVKVEAEFALGLRKTADPESFSKVGQQITYTITLENDGDFAANQIRIEDPLTGLEEMLDEIKPGSTLSFTTLYTVTEADVAAGRILNTAYASLKDAGGIEFAIEAQKTVHYEPEVVDLDVVKTVDRTEVKVGELVTYTISVTNRGTHTVENVLVKDFLPAELMFISANLEREGDDLVFIIPKIAPEETFHLNIEAMAITPGEVVNLAHVSIGDFEREAEAEPVLIRDVLVDMAITKTSFNQDIIEGENFEYEIVVVNNGADDAHEVVVIDELPQNLTYVAHSHTADFDAVVEVQIEGKKVTWTIAHFPAGGHLVITLEVKAGNKGEVVNEVRVTSREADARPEDNMDRDQNKIGRVFLPNVITPDGDDKNEFFYIEGLNKYKHNKLTIFNRYGDHVYEVENYQQNWNARGLNSGTYYYVLETTDANGLQTTFKGWVQVIKDKEK